MKPIRGRSGTTEAPAIQSIPYVLRKGLCLQPTSPSDSVGAVYRLRRIPENSWMSGSVGLLPIIVRELDVQVVAQVVVDVDEAPVVQVNLAL